VRMWSRNAFSRYGTTRAIIGAKMAEIELSMDLALVQRLLRICSIRTLRTDEDDAALRGIFRMRCGIRRIRRYLRAF
jgi:hypothetical protein